MSLRSQIATQPLQRAAEVRAGSLDKDARTIEVVISTGAMVRRRGWVSEWDEALPVDRARLERLNSIGVVLDNHRAYGSVADTLGAVVAGSVRVEGTQLVGKIKFARTQRGDDVLALIEDGVLRAVSVGYDVDEYEETRAKDRADGGKRSLLTPTSWEPYEVSVVQMPADAGATVRADNPDEIRRYAVRSTEESPMPEPIQTTAAQAAPALDEQAIAKRAIERLSKFEAQGRSLNIDLEKVRSFVKDLSDDGAVGLAMLELAAERQKAQDIKQPQPPSVTIGREAGDKMADAIGLAVMHRGLRQADPRKVRAFNDKLRTDGRASEIVPSIDDETTRKLARSRLLDIAEAFLNARGIRTGSMNAGQIAETALSYRAGTMATTADFPGLLANTANKLLSIGYAETTSSWRDIGLARRLDRPDFKQFTMYRRSGAPGLARINEHGEIKRSGWGDSTGLTGQLKTAGVEVAFTRQMLINDDLDAFAQQNLGLGDSAIRWEDDYVITTVLYGNPTLGDSVALFDAARGNLSTDVGTPDIASIINAGRMFAAMTETIKDPASNNGTTTRKLSFQLVGFLCALSEKLAIDQILEPRFPDASSNKTPSQLQGLQTWQDNRLQVEAAAPDVHFALSNRTALVYGGLEGDPSPRLSMQATTGIDGVVWGLVHDWYCDVEDPKAIIRIPKS